MLNKVQVMLSKGLAFIYVFIKYHLKRQKKVKNKDILIIFGGHLGNAVLNIDLLLQMREKYIYSEGRNIYIFCNNKVRKILETIGDMSEFEFLDISFPYEDGGTRLKSVLSTLKYFRNKEFDKIVVNLAHIMPLAQYIVAAVVANDSIGVFDDLQHTVNESKDIEHNIGKARWYFESAFKTQIRVDYNTQEVQRQKLILKHLDIDYKIRIYPIKRLCEFEYPKNKYFTVTVDSASYFKRWNPEKFAQVINYVCNKYDLSVCVTGGKEAVSIYENMSHIIENKSKVLNYIGRTSFEEWTELLRGSLFHFGVDSGSIHIASSVGTQAFCLIGVWDGTRVLPYQIEEESVDTLSPICIYMNGAMELPCYGCTPKRGLMGSGNEECLKRRRDGQICFCLQSIEPYDAYEVIDQWLKYQEY